jgi:L-aminopeptidase/D-esterase-like protein
MDHIINDTITAVPGLKVGQVQNTQALTGCTVIICDRGAVAGVDQRGGAPGTRETDLLRPMHLVDKVHAIALAGGSAYGLDVASGVMRFLEENKIGFNVGVAQVPIVPAAILFDLAIGDPNVRPDAQMGYDACFAANSEPVKQGNYGAGTGATIGKIFGTSQAIKSGIGSSVIHLGGNLKVAALIAVNAFGDVIDPQSGKIIAGARTIKKGPIQFGAQDYYADTLATMRTIAGKTILQFASNQNTIIGVVATNARLTKEEANKVAQMAHNGLAKTISPAHTMFDGDTIFCLSTGSKKANVNLIGAYAVETVSRAIINAIKFAEPAGGLPSANSIH